jgi:hypothetical protein
LKNGNWPHFKGCHCDDKKHWLWKMDVTTLTITPLTSNLEDQDSPLVSPMGTCPMFRDMDVRVCIVSINVNDWARHIWHLVSPFWRSSSSSFPCGSKECELEHVTTIDESTWSGSKKKTWFLHQKHVHHGVHQWNQQILLHKRISTRIQS